jgi:nicotinamide-nucleotide amidase
MLRHVTIELINTGSELLLGRVLNTHQQWICRQLADLGHSVGRQVAVPDGGHDIQQAVREALGRADLVITTGGLGPTCDDITRDLIAQLLGRKLFHDDVVWQIIARFFTNRGRPIPERTKVEALVPEGATVLLNAYGTAPGLVLEVAPNHFRTEGKPSLLVMLPGPPRELRPMFTEQVVPLIQRRFPQQEDFVCRTLKTTGLGESYMEERIATPLKHLTDAGMDLGFCARVGEVDVRFVARGPKAATTVAEAETVTRWLVNDFIFGTEDDSLESVLVHELTARGKTLVLAESCTGGHIANRITNIPGASAVLRAGFVTYANEAKVATLGVRPETLTTHGAVSDATAKEMAEGARRVTGADFALAVTGIAGPAGGSEAKPVGTVFIALSSAKGSKVAPQLNRFDRETFKYLTAQQAMMMLLQALKTGE